MGGAVMSRIIIVGSGLLYPAYSSYKAVSKADLRLYVRWMMYWIVFAMFASIEVVTDVFLAWLPFYYEFKVVFVLWLASPYTKGAAFLYRKFIHPHLLKREEEIDLFLENARDRGYQTMMDVGSRGINMAANAVVTAAVRGQSVVSNKLRSYSVTDLSRIPELADFRREPLTRRMTCQPLIREVPTQSGQPQSGQPQTGLPLTSNNRSYLRPVADSYSVMDMIEDCARKVTSSVETANNDLTSNDDTTTSYSFTIDDMEITQRNNSSREAVPTSDDFPTHYHTLPRPRSANRIRQIHPFPPTEEQ